MTLARLGPPPTELARAVAVLGDGCALDLAAQLAGLTIAQAAPAAGELVRTGVLARREGAALPPSDPLRRRARDAVGARAGGRPRGGRRPAARTRRRTRAHRAAAAARGAERRRPGRVRAARGGRLTRTVAAPRRRPSCCSDARWTSRRTKTCAASCCSTLGRAELEMGAIAAGRGAPPSRRTGARQTRARAAWRSRCWAPRGATARTTNASWRWPATTLPDVEPLDPDLALRLQALLALVGRLDEPPIVAGATAAEASFLGHLVFARMRPGASADRDRGASRCGPRGQADALVAARRDMARLHGRGPGALLDRPARRTPSVVSTAAIAQARRRGSITDFASAMTMRANVHRRAGRLRDAEADARTALEAVLEPDWSFARGVAPLVCTLVDQGRVDEAASELAAALRGEDIPDSPPMIPVLLARMWVRAARREHAAALADWEEALRRICAARHQRGLDRGLRGRRRRPRARPAIAPRAAATAAQARELADAWGTPGARGQALHAQARVGGRRRGDRHCCAAPSSCWPRARRGFEEARARVSLGAALRRAGPARRQPRPAARGLRARAPLRR